MEEDGFGLTGMAGNGRSQFWSDWNNGQSQFWSEWNGLKWKKSVLV
jgi:hypothetical protein